MPGGDRKIAFDKYHVAAHLGGAVDKVRCDEHRVLRADGDERLKDTKYFWLQPEAMSEETWKSFEVLRERAP
ncbi:MAG: transposase [Nannocystaceae bacterium]